MPTPKSCKAFTQTAFSLAILASCLTAVAQEAVPPEDSMERAPRTAIKAVKYADVAAIEPLVELVGVDVAVDPKRKLLVIRGPNSIMDTAIALIDALDTPEPPWGIELLVHLVAASKEPAAGQGIPADLEAALAELTELFGYRGFELVDTVFLFASTDAGSARVRAPVRDGGIFDVGFDGARVIYGEPKHSVLFENLTIQAIAADIDLQTNVEVKEGHKVLIGKSSLRGAGEDKDLVLVIEIRLKATWPRDSEG